jgi:hypothetical protein
MNPQPSTQPNNSAQVPMGTDDTKIMSGSPGGSMPSASPGAVAPSDGSPHTNPSSGGSATASSAPQASGGSASKDIYLGDRRFSSNEELAAYAATLKPKADLADRLMNQLSPQSPQQINEEDQLAEMIYEDPKKAVRGIVALAKKELNEESNVRQTAENTKKVFYDSYKDLVGQEDIVSMEYQKLQQSYAQAGKSLDSIPIVEVSSKIANAARERIARIKGQSVSSREVLPDGNPVVVGAGSSAPSAPSGSPARKTMFEQMKDMKAQKGKAVRH